MPVETKDGYHWLAPTITAHAWSPDRKMLALCPNTREVWIYSGCDNSDASKWTRKWVLKEHEMVVSGIDWSPVTNKIVTCSHDRNAFVWTLDAAGAKWDPCIAILRIERAALRAAWAPDGNKFAVSSGHKVVPVCHFEEENNWWVSDHIKKHKSTVLSIAWHPNSQIVATASTDFKCRVFSAFVEEVDKGMDAGPFAAQGDLGELLLELDGCRGWVTDVAWSPTGTRLAYAGHDSSIAVVHFAADPAEPPAMQVLQVRGLPHSCLSFLSEDSLVAAGHDFNPALFALGGGGEWAFVENVDKKKEAATAAKSSAFAASRAMFASKAKTGTSDGGGSASVWTKHQGAITDLQPYSAPGGSVSAFSTVGTDGRLVVWDLRKCGVDAAALRL